MSASEATTGDIGSLRLDLEVNLGEFQVIVAEAVPLAGITALFGPSGSGKTTLLRAIAGLERVRGTISAGTEKWLDSAAGIDVPTHRRPVGMVFQDGRLFPHLSVAGNLHYAAKRASRRGSTDERFALADMVTAFDLAELLNRRAHLLSGGERQRVALARTLLAQPRLALLDEPLAAVDAERKADILPYIEVAAARFGVPMIYVSHAIDEVARLADRVLVLADGRNLALGPTQEILDRLDVQALTGRHDAGAVVSATVSRHDSRLHLTYLDFAGYELATPTLADLPAGRPVRLQIRARDVALALERPTGLSIRNVLPGHIAEMSDDPQSAFTEVSITIGDQRVRARITRAAAEALGLRGGLAIYALIKSVSFDRSPR